MTEPIRQSCGDWSNPAACWAPTGPLLGTMSPAFSARRALPSSCVKTMRCGARTKSCGKVQHSCQLRPDRRRAHPVACPNPAGAGKTIHASLPGMLGPSYCVRCESASRFYTAASIVDLRTCAIYKTNDRTRTRAMYKTNDRMAERLSTACSAKSVLSACSSATSASRRVSQLHAHHGDVYQVLLPTNAQISRHKCPPTVTS